MQYIIIYTEFYFSAVPTVEVARRQRRTKSFYKIKINQRLYNLQD